MAIEPQVPTMRVIDHLLGHNGNRQLNNKLTSGMWSRSHKEHDMARSVHPPQVYPATPRGGSSPVANHVLTIAYKVAPCLYPGRPHEPANQRMLDIAHFSDGSNILTHGIPYGKLGTRYMEDHHFNSVNQLFLINSYITYQRDTP